MGLGTGSAPAVDLAALAAVLGNGGPASGNGQNGQVVPPQAYTGSRGVPTAAQVSGPAQVTTGFGTPAPPAAYAITGGPVQTGDSKWGLPGDRQLRYTPQRGSIDPNVTRVEGGGSGLVGGNGLAKGGAPGPFNYDNLVSGATSAPPAYVGAGQGSGTATTDGGPAPTGPVTPVPKGDGSGKSPPGTTTGGGTTTAPAPRPPQGATIGTQVPYTDVWAKLPQGESPVSYALKRGVPMDQMGGFLQAAAAMPGGTPDEVIDNWKAQFLVAPNYGQVGGMSAPGAAPGGASNNSSLANVNL